MTLSSLSLAVPGFARSTNSHFLPIFSGSSANIRPSLPVRRRRPVGTTLNPAPAASCRYFVCAAASSSSFPQPQQVDLSEAEASADTMVWGKVSAILFDMDGVLFDTEKSSPMAAVDFLAEMGSDTDTDLSPFMETANEVTQGEARFLGDVWAKKGIKGFDPEAARKRFSELYTDHYSKAKFVEFPWALDLIMECKDKGLKVAVASSADRIKVDADLAAAGMPTTLFDAIVSADAFHNVKPAPDIFLAASTYLNVPPSEDVLGLQGFGIQWMSPGLLLVECVAHASVLVITVPLVLPIQPTIGIKRHIDVVGRRHAEISIYY